MRLRIILILVLVAVFFPIMTFSQPAKLKVRPITEDEYYKFVKIFSEIRGPIRREILKERKDDYKNADPLEYISKVQNDGDVQKVIKANDLNWEQFNELMGNLLLGYFCVQQGQTKAAILRKILNEVMSTPNNNISQKQLDVVKNLLSTDEGAAIATTVLEKFLKVPVENIAIAQKNQRQLDQLFYTNFWEDKLE